jgi:hypothetical protein
MAMTATALFTGFLDKRADRREARRSAFALAS